jgi:hypothetical protein
VKFCLLSLLAASCAVPVPEAPPHLEALRELTVIVDGVCAGVIVSTHSVLTAGHCIVEGDAHNVTTQARERFPAYLLASWDVPDLAELSVPRADWQRVAAVRAPAPGASLIVVHHVAPGGWAWLRTEVVRVSSIWHEATLDFAAPGGTSGSPAFAFDTNGALACVVTARGETTGQTYCAIPQGDQR